MKPNITFLNKLTLWALCALVLACLPLRSQAATPEEEARMKQCPEGDYAGPGTGAKRSTKTHTSGL